MEDVVTTAGGAGEYSVNVDIQSLGDSYSKLTNRIDKIAEALQKADDAAKQAIEAAGGDSTRVGQAIAGSLKAVNSVEFARVKERVTNLANGVRILENAYSEEEDELVNAINNYKEGYNGNAQ